MDGFCGHTRKPEFAKEPTPLCPREPKPDHPEQEEIEKGHEKMNDEKEILRKQLQLLSEKSDTASTNMLIELTMAMVEVSKAITYDSSLRQSEADSF